MRRVLVVALLVAVASPARAAGADYRLDSREWNGLGRLAEDIPEIAEMDLNPVIVSPTGVVAVDAKLRLAPNSDDDESTVRRLR